MQWTDVLKAPSTSMLRQFSGLWLVVFGGLAAWRAYHGDTGAATQAIAVAAAVIGVAGLIKPALVRPIYSGWMILAFPIGWTVSKLSLALMFFGVFTAVSVVFAIIGRDILGLKRPSATSYWTPKGRADSSRDYLRQY